MKTKYDLIKEIIGLVEDFESNRESNDYSNDLIGFKKWVSDGLKAEQNLVDEPNWEGKENGRSAESVINTQIVHLNRYAKTYSKAVITDSKFSTQDEFIFLINLKAFGPLSKMELIRRNIQEKPSGMLIINRLIQQGWVEQRDSETDKRSKIILISAKGLKVLEGQMDKIRQATQIVAGNLSYGEKLELIRLLNKLEHFHQKIFLQNIENSELLEKVLGEYMPSKS